MVATVKGFFTDLGRHGHAAPQGLSIETSCPSCVEHDAPLSQGPSTSLHIDPSWTSVEDSSF
ncbi:hypothetical protein TRIUR3_26964 [Triticum urartu]|uniref:Uncharacterized protein n=1 Tax=Triticum urartu TaxID=4572 RepID=M7ZX35_TRIUA|nr:hypothetical protein TRIUR3_26964 [Triticum urartu]